MTLDFAPIGFTRQGQYLELLAQTPQVCSDYSFINLIAWQEAYGLEWAFAGSLAWIRQSRPQPALWAPVGDWDAVDWAALLAGLFPAGASFIRIPEKLARLWETCQGLPMVLEEDRDQWDYLYSVSDLIALPGKKFHDKKNHLNQFRKRYAHQYVPMDPANARQALSLQETWCQWKDCESDAILTKENEGILRVLDCWERLDRILGGLLFVEDQLAAYTIGEALTADTLLIHFEKGSPDFRGAYQAVNQQFLEHEGQGYSLVNREQDAGDPGLRKAKLSYNPKDFLRKFRAMLRF